jgi:HPt (histidine-containing phosphotransfer) domain-containing protein
VSKPINIKKLDVILEHYLKDDRERLQRAALVNAKLSVKSRTIDAYIDIDAGKMQMGGSEEAYMNVLSTYLEDMKKRRMELVNIIERGDLSLFTIYVHAIKGASAGVRADNLSTLAAELEKMGKAQQFDKINDKLKPFFTEMENVIKYAEYYVGKYNSAVESKVKKHIEHIPKDKLNKLVQYTREFNMVKIESLIMELSQYTYGDVDGETLKQIKLAADSYDYDKIVEIVKSILS